jgi:hypothetical protein
VRFQVVNADHRQPAGQRQALGGVHADHQRAGQPGPRVTAMASRSREAHVRLLEGLLDGVNGADVLARSHLGEDAAKFGVQLDLRGHHAGNQRRRFPRSAAVSSHELSMPRMRAGRQRTWFAFSVPCFRAGLLTASPAAPGRAGTRPALPSGHRAHPDGVFQAHAQPARGVVQARLDRDHHAGSSRSSGSALGPLEGRSWTRSPRPWPRLCT